MTSLIKNEEATIIKADKVGRQQTPTARRERLPDEFDRSGLSAPEFVKLTGLKYSTFAAWVHRRRKTTTRGAAGAGQAGRSGALVGSLGGTPPATDGPPVPAHLETERVVLEPEEVKQQPAGWRKLGEEVTEELDWKPAKFIKRLYIRPKYANAERIVIAPLPARRIERGLPGAGLLTQVIISKHEDHLPLYRQAQICRQRHGVELSRQTLCGWVEAAADWLSPIYREIKTAWLAKDYLQVDETPIRHLDPDSQRPPAKPEACDGVNRSKRLKTRGAQSAASSSCSRRLSSFSWFWIYSRTAASFLPTVDTQ
jgi:transposase